MFEGTKVQVDKLENGYGIKTGDDTLAGNGNVRKFVFENFGSLVRHLARLLDADMTAPEVERGPLYTSRRLTASDIMSRMRGEEPPSYDDIRDELGEARRQLKQALTEQINMSAGLKLITDKYTDLEKRYFTLREERDLLAKRIEKNAKKTPARKR